MKYSLEPETGRVVNEHGHVAVHYIITENSKRVVMDSSHRDYFFNAQNHVNLAWVHPDDVPALLKVQEKSCNCNNGTYKNAFILASLTNVNIFHTGQM
jgi:hypothetical protein